MSLPMFFHEGTLDAGSEIVLNEEAAKHIVQVLRMQAGGRLQLTNGNGSAANVVITDAGKKKCTVTVQHITNYKERNTKLHLCMAFTKNTGRNEWLLEKATELGVSSITPLIAARTERERIRYDRWNNILIAALIQSQQHYLPHLQEASSLGNVLSSFNDTSQKLIGHCINELPRTPLALAMKPAADTIIVIGPEGDFTRQEVDQCLENGFAGVSMGSQRLRTETAAMTACAYFNLINYEA